MKRITRDRPLTPIEVAAIQVAREQVAADLPELIATYRAQVRSRRVVRKLFDQLQATQRSKGLALVDLPVLTAKDRFTLTEYEAGRPTVLRLKTLRRYALAVGKRVVVSLTDA